MFSKIKEFNEKSGLISHFREYLISSSIEDKWILRAASAFELLQCY